MLETELTPNSKTWHSGVESPEIIENPSVYQWSDEADLIVIGLGGAGVSAANEALDHNLSVIAIDKTTGGGATARSGGVFYAGGGTLIQKEANISDTPDNMYRYLKQEVGNIVKDETLRKFCDTSPANTQWLMDNGVKFNSSYYQTKTSYTQVQQSHNLQKQADYLLISDILLHVLSKKQFLFQYLIFCLDL